MHPMLACTMTRKSGEMLQRNEIQRAALPVSWSSAQGFCADKRNGHSATYERCAGPVEPHALAGPLAPAMPPKVAVPEVPLASRPSQIAPLTDIWVPRCRPD